MEAKKNKDGSYALTGAREPPKKIPVSLASGVFNVGRLDAVQLWLRCVGAEGAERENKGYEFLLRKNVCHGDIIEKKIIEHFNLTPGEKIEDDTFSGIPDAIGDDFIVEIKSTTQFEDWKRNGIPSEYIYQALIYASMLGKKYAIITIYDLSAQEYENPKNVKNNPKKIKKIPRSRRKTISVISCLSEGRCAHARVSFLGFRCFVLSRTVFFRLDS